jgi:transcriptional regulator with XRE-family HTH domain
MKKLLKRDTQKYDYLRLFGIRIRNSTIELAIAESKGLKSSHISTLCRITGLSLDDIAVILNVSREQINNRMRKGEFSAREADILLNIAKIIYEFGRIYPDIEDFWLLFLAKRDEFQEKSALEISKTEIGRGRVFELICKERDDYFMSLSKGNNVQKTPKIKRKAKMTRKRASKPYKIVSGRIIDSEKVLKEMQKKRAKIKAIVKQMRENKRVSREAMQRLIRK